MPWNPQPHLHPPARTTTPTRTTTTLQNKVLTNATLFKTILEFHTEIRVRMVAVNVEDSPAARQANQAIQGAMDAIAQQHPQAQHTTVIRDYRPQHTLIEKLVSPDIVYCLLLANLQVRCTTRAATLEQTPHTRALLLAAHDPNPSGA